MKKAVPFWCFLCFSMAVAKDFRVQERVEWMGAYLNRAKVGYSVLATGSARFISSLFPDGITGFPLDPADPDLLVFSETFLDIKAYGSRNEVRWKTLAEVQHDYSLAEMDFELDSAETRFRIHAEVRSHDVLLSIESSGEKREQQIPKPDGPVYIAETLPLRFGTLIRENRPVHGEYHVFEPQQLSIADWDVRLDGTEIWKSDDGTVRVYRIVQDVHGFQPISWIDAEGHVLKEYAPLGEDVGYLAFLETETQAKNPEWIHPEIRPDLPPEPEGREPDLLYSTAVPAGTAIPDPSQVRRMVVDLWNFRMERPLPFGRFQRNLTRLDKVRYTETLPLRIEIRSPDLPIPEKKLVFDDSTGKDYAGFLADEPLVQVAHPDIQALAREITQGADTAWDKASRIFEWMQKNIRTQFRITFPSALEVLRSRKGDCNEQSVLFAALARAAGVPTRIVTGLVYQGGAFYYHAWNEVLVQTDPEELWVGVDPALRQEVADATHIQFGVGGLSEQAYLNGLIGKIRLKIREVEHRDPVPEAD